MSEAIVEKRKYNKELLHWLGLADEDYLAARLLLLNGYLKQGLIFSDTAVEKYLKTLFFSRDKKIPRLHDVSKLYEEVQKMNMDGITPVNTGFISFLSKGYKMRYTDDLENGYNIYLDQIKMLVELDRTVYAIRKDFQLETADGKKIVTRLDNCIEQNDPVLLSKNICFGKCDPLELFKEKTKWLALLIYGNHNTIEGGGENEGTTDDGRFDIVGIKQEQQI